MQISQRMLDLLGSLEPQDGPLFEIAFEPFDRRFPVTCLVRQKPIADEFVKDANASTVKALVRRQLVTQYRQDIAGRYYLRINERGRRAVRQGHGEGLQYWCPLCDKLIAPSFPLHDCDEKKWLRRS